MKPTVTAMEVRITRSLLVFHAAQAIFCPMCTRVMDAKRTVIVSGGEGKPDHACCVDCWDQKMKPAIEHLGRLEQCTVTDGREWFDPKLASRITF